MRTTVCVKFILRHDIQLNIILSMLKKKKSYFNLIFVAVDWFSGLLMICSLMRQQKQLKNHGKFWIPSSMPADSEQAFITMLTWKWQLNATENDKLSVLTKKQNSHLFFFFGPCRLKGSHIPGTTKWHEMLVRSSLRPQTRHSKLLNNLLTWS